MIGTRVGKYRIVGQLGRGATGFVYKAIDETLGRDVAIKVLHPDLADPESLKRFRAEAKVLARLNHPAIATIHELLPSDANLLMVMELVRGETLEALSARVGPMPPDTAASLVERILAALDHAHRAGIVHRDIKPANVMVTESGGVKIMDFGVARIRGTEHITVDGSTLGTPAYMAPEQVSGTEVDGRADLYSVGVIFYQLLTGDLPFDAETPILMMQKQLAESPAPLHVHRPDLPAWCETVVSRALAKAADARFQSAEAFRDALARATGGVSSIELARSFAVAAMPQTSADADAVINPTIAEAVPAVHQRSAAGGLATRGETALRQIKEFARAREGTLLALFIVVGGLAYVALDRLPLTPMSAITSDALPALTFDAKAVVGLGTRAREQDARVVLADGRVTVTADGDRTKALHSVRYRDVRSITYSRGQDPMWRSPKGPASIARLGGGTLGRFGIFVDRHWISLQTGDDSFIVLHVEPALARRMLKALEERTGRTAETLIGR